MPESNWTPFVETSYNLVDTDTCFLLQNDESLQVIWKTSYFGPILKEFLDKKSVFKSPQRQFCWIAYI